MTRLPATRHARRGGERGETLIEFALGAALLFTLLFGILQFGWAIWQYNLVADLAQEGARWAAVRGSTASTQATSATVSSYVTSRSMMAVTTSATWPAGNYPGSVVSVTVTRTPVRFTGYIPFVSSLSSTAQMIIAR
jgi:Flp pilus assembly protein TadG